MTRTRWIIVAVFALWLFGDCIPTTATTLAWTASRAAGVIAFVALTLDVMFGLFVSTGAFDRIIPRGASVDVHKWLSAVSLLLVAVHSLALLGDSSVKFDVLDIVVPWRSSYRPTAVALGVLAMYGAHVVHESFGWRKRIGVRAWRAIHFTAFAVFVLAGIHGLLAGSDSNHGWLRALYATSLAIVVVLVVLRVKNRRR